MSLKPGGHRPVMYDILLDEVRPVTQADVHRMEVLCRRYWALRQDLEALLAEGPLSSAESSARRGG